MEWLKTKWAKRTDSTQKRLMGFVFHEHLTPINEAIVFDDLEMFKSNMVGINMEKMLARSCLCGSLEITKFIFSLLKTDCTEYPYLLGYACCSRNEDLVIYLSTQFKEKGLGMPDSIFTAGTLFRNIDVARQIFY